MNPIEEASTALRLIVDPETQWSDLNSIAEAIRSSPIGHKCVKDVFSLFSRFPDADFGVPGPLAHAVDTFYGEGYIMDLAEALRVGPTEHLLFIAQRVLNRRDQFRDVIVSALEVVASSYSVAPTLRSEAARLVGPEK